DPDRRRALKRRAQEYSKRQSISLIGLNKQWTKERNPLPFAVENFTFSGSYNQVSHRDFKIEEGLSQNVDVGATYDYGFQPLKLEPFKRLTDSISSSRYLDPIRDFNFDPLPNNIAANANFLRQY